MTKHNNSKKNILTKEIIEELYICKEMKYIDIAKKYGVSKSYIGKLIREYGITARPAYHESRLKGKVDKDTLKKLYYIEKKPLKEIGDILGVSERKMSDIFKEFGIKTIKAWSQYKIKKNELIELHIKKGYGISEIGKIKGVSRRVIYNLCRINEIDVKYIRKSNIDDSFFNKESKEFYYILHLLLTDGCISNESIALSLTDRDVIDWVSETIGYKNEIYIANVNLEYKGKIRKCKTKFCISFRNRRINILLKEYGLVERKSKILKFIKPKDEYLIDCIRGAFDGDGCICINQMYKKNDGTISVYGRFCICSCSFEYILGIHYALEKILKNKIKIYKHNNGKTILYTCDIAKRSLLEKLYYELYKDNAFGMNRKKEKFKFIINNKYN